MTKPTLQELLVNRRDLSATIMVSDHYAAVTLAEEFAKALADLHNDSGCHDSVETWGEPPCGECPRCKAAALLELHLPNWRDHE